MAVHVCKWCMWFDSDQDNVKAQQRSGQPSTCADHVQVIDATVQADRHSSIAQVEMRFSLSQGTIWDIVINILAMGKFAPGDETWVFHYTLESKAESVTWKHSDSPVRMKFKTVQSPVKVMATVFCDIYEVLLVDSVSHGSTINAAAYQESLKRFKEAVQKKRPGLLTTRLLL